MASMSFDSETKKDFVRTKELVTMADRLRRNQTL